jgi:hypothetical protein
MVTVAVYVTVIVVLQAIEVSDAGLTERAMPVTSNGPGSLQVPVGPIEEEVTELPGVPTVIDPLTADVELN